MNAKTLLAAAVIAATLPFAALAPSGSVAQEDKPVILEGTIQAASYKEPQATIQVVTAKKAKWTVLLAPVFFLNARGMNAGMLKVGTPVRVEGASVPGKKTELKASKITLDGSNSFLMS